MVRRALASDGRPSYGSVMTEVSLAAGWADATAERLRDLGFTLLNSDRPAAPGASQLLVALRDQPTLRHFDPELIMCWVAADGRGRPLAIDRRAPTGERGILWGHIHVIDRLGIENRFLSFGGSLRIADVTPTLRVVQHVSPGPVVRWGGHSQGLDPLAGAIGAFFGRLIVPVDFEPGAEWRLATTPAEDLYAAFLRDRTTPATRARRATGTDEGDPLNAWLRTEATRVQTHDPGAWAAGEALLHELGFTARRTAPT